MRAAPIKTAVARASEDDKGLILKEV